MAKVARVLENRLANGMPLQLDTTVNYANGKGGITTTSATGEPSPYNTYVHAGLPPEAITTRVRRRCARCSPRPGRVALLRRRQPGHRRDPVRRDRRGAPAERVLFQQWLREHPGG